MPSIGPDDVVVASGKFLAYRNGTRFFMKGIGFPVPLQEDEYNATAWIGILRQFKSLDLEYNTVRMYRMDPDEDYSEFFDEAASMGVYVIVPLTSVKGDGVLDRKKSAPKCYPRKLYRYGVKCLHNYLQYPNVIAGLLANEVMNNLDSWNAAPCIKAYGRDLKVYMESNFAERNLPLMYAAQNSGIPGGVIGDVETMQLTSKYLTCVAGPSSPARSRLVQTVTAAVDEDIPSIDIFGINVESWCSSIDTFEKYETGFEGGYHQLWRGLRNSSVALVFSEMGCSHLDFDKDNGLTEGGVRDWRQVPVVLDEMADTWSGFVAYAYDGNPQFVMFEGGPWRDVPLEPTDDFFNFRDRLKAVANSSQKAWYLPNETESINQNLPICSDVEEQLKSCCGIDLRDFARMRSYAAGVGGGWMHPFLFLVVIFSIGVASYLFFAKKFTRKYESVEYSPPLLEATHQVKYQAIK